MESGGQARYTAFEGDRLIASGEPIAVALGAKAVLDRGERAPVLIFDDATGAQIELDLRGTAEDVLRRLAAPAEASPPPGADAPRGPGRPKLGVVAREVTLLPRHWDWLGEQPGGASVALRKLVEAARRANEGEDRARRAQEAAYRFMAAMAGNAPHFEEALRAFYRGDRRRFEDLTAPWPPDVRDHARRLAAAAFPEPATSP